MKNIIISGGTGLIGSALSDYLSSMGMEVAVLSRSKNKSCPYRVFQWSPVDQYIDPEAMEWADAVINLAGESL
ncbi:MAG TPA: NAD-dependent epimerase/dehydratase family protein, partial [Saprospiraceae bacterium]|nr:NAD-dependent epimerase/dehydratase family protein [Saprospiraceae bacterium]